MTLDRLFIEQNRKSLERMNALATRLTDEELQAKVGEHWTVAIVYAHLAFWERRVLYILETTKRDGKVSALEIDIVANDLSLPLWAAIPARDAVRIALESAEAVDRHLEGYPQSLLEEVFNYNKRWVIRALHRNEHLDEAEAALNS